jgi:hypothetical protein
MRVRELIRALAKHDLDMEVVMAAEPGLDADFMRVAEVEEAVFAADCQEPAHLRLAKLHGEGALVAVRLRTRPTTAAH